MEGYLDRIPSLSDVPPKKFLELIDSAAGTSSGSIILSLLRARLLSVLGHYLEAEEECRRGLSIPNPRDPREDEIPLVGTFIAHGQAPDDRIYHVKLLLSNVLEQISLKLRNYWDTLDGPSKNRILVFNSDAMVEYYANLDQSTAKHMRDDVNYFKKYKTLNFYICPISQCKSDKFPDNAALWQHLRIKHSKEFPSKKLSGAIIVPTEHEDVTGSRNPDTTNTCFSEVIDSYDFIHLRQRGKFHIFTMGSKPNMFELSHLKAKTFTDWRREKLEKGTLVLKELKNKLKTGSIELDNGKVVTTLWNDLLKICSLDYREFLLPFIRLFQWREVYKSMSEKESLSIGHDYIESILREHPVSRRVTNPIDEVNKYTESFLDHLSPTGAIICRGKLSLDAGKFDLEAGPIGPGSRQSKPVANYDDDAASGKTSDDDGTDSEKANDDDGTASEKENDDDGFQDQKNFKRLIIYTDKVPGTGHSNAPALYYASVTDHMSRSSLIRCVVTDRMRLKHANLIFSLLLRCQHPNILKPHGIWLCDDKKDSGYILFPNFDGTIGEIPIRDLLIEENTVFNDFTEKGFRVLRDIVRAVHYVNVQYNSVEDGTSGNTVPLLLFPVQISLDSIFYMKDAAGDYHVLLGNFNTENSLPEQTNINVESISRVNWNALGSCLSTLFSGHSIDLELNQLVNTLKDPSVSYNELLWEPGAWDVEEKMLFIREVCWSLKQRKLHLKEDPLSGYSSLLTNLDTVGKKRMRFMISRFLEIKFLATKIAPTRCTQDPRKR